MEQRVQDARGALGVQVSALPVIAGTQATVTLIIRNPFPEDIYIESIEAPRSEPLLPRRPVRNVERAGVSQWKTFLEALGRSFAITSVSAGPLVARFPKETGRTFSFDLEQGATLHLRRAFGPMDTVSIKASPEASIFVEDSEELPPADSASETVLAAYQDDVASFDLRTAHWLFVTPKVLELHAVIRYRIGSIRRSQVVPFSLTVRPPVKALMCGSISGSLLGFLAKQLSKDPSSLAIVPTAISLAGIAVMAIILSIVLSRQDGSKGFVTLEDFYGAFIVGVLLGYTGSSYFDGIMHAVGNAAAPSK